MTVKQYSDSGSSRTSVSVVSSSRVVSESLIWALVLSLSVLVRYVVSMHPYSGHATPPMFGDYEAQRHWMEITTKLPVTEWYFNTTNNNLQYWGLDYPPLTAYSSWLFGKVGEIIEPESMKLFTSRGYETASSKLFMRSTVVVSDLLVWLPAVYFFVQTFYKEQTLSKRITAFLFISMQPSLLLIDHGHFQYNGISLGFALIAATFILRNQQLLASIFFVLSLNYKQMSLYYSPAFFFYLLFTNLSFSNITKSIVNVGKIGIVVIITFIVCWIPFLSLEQASQVLFRLFPVARGLYEDKVANFWCVASTAINFKSKFTHDQLLKLCTIATLAGISTIVYPMIKRCWSANINKSDIGAPSRQQQLTFIYSLIVSAFAFFLFSFQVHEKTILLPLLPVSLLILESSYLSLLFGLMSTFSMFPLLYKDGLALPYFITQYFYIVVGYQLLHKWNELQSYPTIKKGILIVTLFLIEIAHCLFEYVPPPGHLPALFHLLIATISFGYFCLTVLYILRELYKSPKKSKQH